MSTRSIPPRIARSQDERANLFNTKTEVCGSRLRKDAGPVPEIAWPLHAKRLIAERCLGIAAQDSRLQRLQHNSRSWRSQMPPISRRNSLLLGLAFACANHDLPEAFANDEAAAEIPNHMAGQTPHQSTIYLDLPTTAEPAPTPPPP